MCDRSRWPIYFFKAFLHHEFLGHIQSKLSHFLFRRHFNETCGNGSSWFLVVLRGLFVSLLEISCFDSFGAYRFPFLSLVNSDFWRLYCIFLPRNFHFSIFSRIALILTSSVGVLVVCLIKVCATSRVLDSWSHFNSALTKTQPINVILETLHHIIVLSTLSPCHNSEN